MADSESDDDSEEDQYEIEDFTTKKSVFVYIEQKGEDVKATQVLGHFTMHPSLQEDIEMLINLTWH